MIEQQSLNSRFTKNSGKEFALVALLFLLLACFFNIKPILDGMLFEARDLWLHLFWLEQFYREFSEGIYYPKWLASGNYGLGSPAFVFYPPFIYWLGTAFRCIAHTNVQTESIFLQVGAVWAAGMAAYCYGRSKFGIKPALCAAIYYTTAPYLVYDVYMRAALSEIWTFAEIPLLFWATEKALLNNKYGFLVSISSFALLITNIPISILTSLIWMSYVLVLAVTSRTKSSWSATGIKVAKLLLWPLLGAGLAGFYLLPAVTEKSFIYSAAWLEPTRGGITYGTNAFMQSRELFITFWYATVSTFALAFAAWLTTRASKTSFIEFAPWHVMCAVQLIAISGFGSFLWQIPLFQYIQFSWRGLVYISLVGFVFFGYAVAGALKLPSSKVLIRSLCLVMLCQFLISNLLGDYLLAKFRRGLRNNESQMITGEYEMNTLYARASTLPNLLESATWFPEAPEYRPVILTSGLPVPEPKPTQPPLPLVTGDASYQVTRWSTYDRQFFVQAASPGDAKLRLFYFPGWTAYVDGMRAQGIQGDDGLLRVKIPSGNHQVEVRFESTALDVVGIYLSLGSLLLLVGSIMRSFLILPMCGDND